MMFSTKAEYGVRVMAHLAGKDGHEPTSLGSIAEAEGLQALEGEIAPIECITADADGALVCAREGHSPCPTKLLWTRVQGSIVRTLNEMTLADLVRPQTKEKLTA